jgi:hypothetical protein
MTPTERARRLNETCRHGHERRFCFACIAEEFAEAVAAERDACARIAEAKIDEVREHIGSSEVVDTQARTAAVIADAIRKRSEA